jgi:hypothetical protein
MEIFFTLPEKILSQFLVTLQLHLIFTTFMFWRVCHNFSQKERHDKGEALHHCGIELEQYGNALHHFWQHGRTKHILWLQM